MKRIQKIESICREAEGGDLFVLLATSHLRFLLDQIRALRAAAGVLIEFLDMVENQVKVQGRAPLENNHTWVTQYKDGISHTLTVGDFRRLRAALAESEAAG